jgi:hypothetical protein
METTAPTSLRAKVAREDRVRARTKPDINQKIDTDLEQRIRFYSAQDHQTISARLEELDREWDIERLLEANAASLSLGGILLGTLFGRKWFLVSLLVSGFLLKHAIDGWCPPVPVLRKAGVRTRMEIEQERYALKILRGDFDHIERKAGDPLRNANQVVEGIRA